MSIPQVNKALFPDAPVISEPIGQVNSVVAAGLIKASTQSLQDHNKQIDKNLDTLKQEQQAALDRQNAANFALWQQCNGTLKQP